MSKVFIIGDARTGTMSLHKFLLALGKKSIHYYVKEAKQIEPDKDNHDDNWLKAKDFFDNSGYDAFSDYPTRLFYKELAETYPDAYYILSTRESVEKWRKSMEGFFSKFNFKLDLDALTDSYNKLNDEIRAIFGAGQKNFVEVCIDDSNKVNSEKIKNLLGIDSPLEIGWENQTGAYDNDLYSRRAVLFNTDSENFLEYIEKVNAEKKGMLSESGWIYLINDTNNFMRYLFGLLTWDSRDADKFVKTIASRNGYLRKNNASYFKFVIPEKSVVYDEFLPNLLLDKDINEERPARWIERRGLEFAWYLGDYLRDSKSYGNLYFRGDTHTNWLGGFFVYLFIIQKVLAKFPGRSTPIKLRELNVEIAGYDGDIFEQIPTEQKTELKGTWSALQHEGLYDKEIRYYLAEENMKSKKVDVPNSYKTAFSKRETLIYENPDKKLPKAVIFRDSTCDFVTDLLAQHFSRSVFVWHNGLVYKEVVEREQPDVVIHVMAERFMTQYEDGEAISSIELQED